MLLPPIEHNNKVWTAIDVTIINGDIRYNWPIDELFTRRPNICKSARIKYNISFPRGIAEGTARRNCRCLSCKEAWIN